MNKILIIEDDTDVAKELYEYFKDIYHVQIAGSLKEGRELLRTFMPDLLVLDLILPDGNGLTLLKDGEVLIPTIILTSMDIEEFHIDGLGYGAKDYLIKPISMKILAKHIEVRLAPKEERYLVSGKLCIDVAKRIVTYDGKQIGLTATELNILIYLFKNHETYHTAQEIYEAVYDSMLLQSTTMKMHLSHLRNKLLMAAPEETFITTQYGKGYRFLKE